MTETVIYPFSPTTCTVLGSHVREIDFAWAGLYFDRARMRTQSTLMLAVAGKEAAPYDLHLDVPWRHPQDSGEPDCIYRVRPKMRAGTSWRGRKVTAVAIERDDKMSPPWVIRVTYAGRAANTVSET